MVFYFRNLKITETINSDCDNFDWKLYLDNYPHLKISFDTKDKAWYHYINIGEKEGYIYFDVNKYQYFLDKYTDFDWELYLENYSDLKIMFDTKDKAWWHYINVGEKEEYIYFDISKREYYYNIRNTFDWEFYLINYPDLKIGYNSHDKAWWHYINIGEKEGFVYFGIQQHEENMKKYKNFDWEAYLIAYPDLKDDIDGHDKAWKHYNTIGKKEGFVCFGIQQHEKNILLKRKNLFYYVGTTAYQDFNTGIQRVSRNISNIIGNYFNEYNLFLVIYDDEKDSLRLLNNDELTIFTKYNGYNHLETFDYTKKNELFEVVKKNGLYITLFIPELFHTNQYDLLEKIIQTSKSKNYKTVHIYYDDTIYNNIDIEESVRKNIFENYIKIISSIDIILPISNYSKSTYLFHKNRLDIDTNQLVEAIPLSGELLNFKRNVNKANFNDNYIFANISVTRRKNADSLIKAFNLLQNDYPELKLIICGVVYAENEYYHTFKDYLNENIIFDSNKTDEEIGELYKNALFSVYPSIEEGFGLPIYESLWYCTPVICHNATSTLEIANEINSQSVSCIDCLNIEELYLQMKNWMNINEIKGICKEIKNIKVKSWYQYTSKIVTTIDCDNTIINKQKTLYYYVHHTSRHTVRTGIQVVTIYIAKQLLKKNIDIVFVNWDEINNVLIPCNHLQLNNLFNYGETEVIPHIHYNNYEPIHISNTNIENSVFLNPEFTQPDLAYNLYNYLKKYNITSIHILYDIIPLVLKDYKYAKTDFFSYFYNNILKCDKIIAISDFTKTEIIDYCKKQNIFKIDSFPLIKSVLLPYQYRNKNKIIRNEIASYNNDEIIILLPGTLEPRKQQILFLELFSIFVRLNPEINVRVVTFGNCWFPIEKLNELIKNSNNKIEYLGNIDNEKLFELYKTATFSCFLSYYEGFGFPISESLWHGTPVLTANFGSMYEIAQYGGCYCIDVTKEVEIYNALETLIKNPNILDNLKKEIEVAEFNKCTWENYADKIYKEIMNI